MLEPADIDRIAHKAAASALDGVEVVDVFGEPTLDSGGQDALLITVVIRPGKGAVSDDAALNAIVGIYNDLFNAGEERSPIVDFATEDEMMQMDDDT